MTRKVASAPCLHCHCKTASSTSGTVAGCSAGQLLHQLQMISFLLKQLCSSYGDWFWHLPVQSAYLAWIASGTTVTRTAAWSGLPANHGTITPCTTMMLSARQEEQTCGVQVCLTQQIFPVWLQATVCCMLVLHKVSVWYKCTPGTSLTASAGAFFMDLVSLQLAV